MCDYLIVAVGTDDYIRKHKKHEPLLSYSDRAYVVNAIQYVDRVVATDNHDKMAMYEKYHFDVLFAGWDHLSDEEDMESIAQLEQLGIKTIFVERQRNLSSSMIKERAYELEKERKRHIMLQNATLVHEPIAPQKQTTIFAKNLRVYKIHKKGMAKLKHKVALDKKLNGKDIIA